MNERKYTAGQVARALRLPLTAFRTWARRAYLGFPETETEGQWRKFSAQDVARLAAIANLTAQGLSVSDAAAVIDCPITGPDYWHAMVERGDEHIFVCVERRAGDTIRSEIFPDASSVKIFLTEPMEGCQVGTDDADQVNHRPVYRSVFDVGPAVVAAVAEVKAQPK